MEDGSPFSVLEFSYDFQNVTAPRPICLLPNPPHQRLAPHTKHLPQLKIIQELLYLVLLVVVVRHLWNRTADEGLVTRLPVRGTVEGTWGPVTWTLTPEHVPDDYLELLLWDLLILLFLLWCGSIQVINGLRSWIVVSNYRMVLLDDPVRAVCYPHWGERLLSNYRRIQERVSTWDGHTPRRKHSTSCLVVTALMIDLGCVEQTVFTSTPCHVDYLNLHLALLPGMLPTNYNLGHFPLLTQLHVPTSLVISSRYSVWWGVLFLGIMVLGGVVTQVLVWHFLGSIIKQILVLTTTMTLTLKIMPIPQIQILILQSTLFKGIGIIIVIWSATTRGLDCSHYYINIFIQSQMLL